MVISLSTVIDLVITLSVGCQVVVSHTSSTSSSSGVLMCLHFAQLYCSLTMIGAVQLVLVLLDHFVECCPWLTLPF